MRPPLLEPDPRGLWCAAGGFHIDPWEPVPLAVVTHAHSDHARWGCGSYLCAEPGLGVLRERIGPEARIETLPYGERRRIGGVTVSLHPAGHLLGSAQVRLERDGEVWVASGDYKLEADGVCAPFEPVPCHTFVTESTFGLPIYRWRPQAEVMAELHAWWRANQARGRASVVFAYALGKAQRLLRWLEPLGPVVTHGAVERLLPAHRAAGVELPPTLRADDPVVRDDPSRCLVVAPPSAQHTPWLRRFGEHSDALASGWMLVRGTRRRRNVDRGLVLSDHADWPGLLTAIAATGAQRVLVTHGQVPVLVRWLNEHGIAAEPLLARYGGAEDDDGPAAPGAEAAA